MSLVSRWSSRFVNFRPEMKKEAPMAILYEVPHQLDEAQMRAASLHRFLGKRKVR